MVRPIALPVAIAVSLLAVSGAGGAGAQTPRMGGTVVYGFRNEPPCFNVLVPVCSSVNADGRVPGLVLRGAFKPDPRNTLQLDLVSKVEFTRTAPFTLTYHIRPEAHWSDGVEISAQDFVFTHRAIQKYFPWEGRQLDLRPDHGSKRACARPEDSQGRPPHALCGLAKPVQQCAPAPCARG